MACEVGCLLAHPRRLAFVVATLVIGTLPNVAWATPVTFDFTMGPLAGRIDPLAASTFGIDASTQVTGSFTYDTAWADSNPDPNFGFYTGGGTGFGFTLNLGSGVFHSDNLTITIVNATPDDFLVNVGVLLGPANWYIVTPPNPGILEWRAQPLFVSDGLPSGPFPTVFQYAESPRLSFELDVPAIPPSSSLLAAGGTLNALQFREPSTTVPEPSTLVLLAMGLAAVAAAGSRAGGSC